MIRRDFRPARRVFHVVALVAIVAWAYSTSFAGVFVFDDYPGIRDNASIRSLSSALRPPVTSPLSGRPVTNLTFAANYALGHELKGYHLFNLLIHTASVCLLFGIVRRTLLTGPLIERFGTHATPLAFAVALLWGVHPLNTGAVVYVVQRVESLMGCFYLLTVYAAIRATDPGTSRRWIAVAGVACALGMGSKEVMITAPVIAWLWDVVFIRAPWRPWADPHRRILYAVLCSSWLFLGALLTRESEAWAAIRTALSAQATGHGWTPPTYLFTQAGVILHYLRIAVIPAPLVLDYYGWPPARSLLQAAPQLFVVSALIGATAALLVTRRPLGFAGVWLFLILAPTSSIVPVPTEIVAEHRMYLPLIAVVATAVLIVYAVGARIARGLHGRGAATAGVPGVAAVLCMTVLTFAFAQQTRARGRVYSSEEGIWLDTIEKRPDNARARINYGVILMRTGRYAHAEQQMRVARDLPADRKTHAQVQLQLGAALCAQRRCEEGIVFIDEALRIDPGLDDADAVLGQAYADVGNIEKAIRYLQRAVDKRPDNPAVLTKLAWLLITTNTQFRDGARGLELAERAVLASRRSNAAALEVLGVALAERGRFGEAMTALQEAALLAERDGDVQGAAALRRQVEVFRTR